MNRTSKVNEHNAPYSDKWTVLHTNLRGLDSKQVMLNNIVADLDPSVLNICELLLKSKRKLKIPGYKCFNVNRDGVNRGGGVGICVANRDSSHVLKLKEGKYNELLVTCHNQFMILIGFINWLWQITNNSLNLPSLSFRT